MDRKVIDLRDVYRGKKYIDIHHKDQFFAESIKEKRKKSILIKFLNFAFVAVFVGGLIVGGFKIFYKKSVKLSNIYDLALEERQSLYIFNLQDSSFKETKFGNSAFNVFWSNIFDKWNKVIVSSGINEQQEIDPVVGEEMGILFLKDGNFVIFLETKASLSDLSYIKGKIEKELMKTCNVAYESYNNFSISSVKSLDEKWLDIHYMFIDNYLVVSNQKDLLKKCIAKKIAEK